MTAALMFITVARPGDAHRRGERQDGGGGVQAVGEKPLTAEARRRLMEEGKQIFRYRLQTHLCVERCAWGVSRWTWLIWLAASALLLTYCLLRGEAMLSAVQAVNIAAIVTTLLLLRRSNRVCPHHLKAAAEYASAP